MKSTIYLIAFLILTISSHGQNTYTLTGSFSGPQTEDWIYMVKFFGDYSTRDSAKIENGKFKFEGTINVPEVYAFHYRMDKIVGVASGFIEPGKLNLVIDVENWDLNSKITGGKINDEFNRLEVERINNYMKPIWALDKKSQTANPEEKKLINDSLQMLTAANGKFEIEYVNHHLDSPIALYLLCRNQFSLSTDEKGRILSQLDPSLQNTTIYKTLNADYENQLALKNQSQLSDTDDIQFIFSGLEEELLLDKLVKQNPDKVLYIDIWGTWCGPCKKEFPFSKKLYDEIDHDKVQMIYLCVGSTKEAWEQMVQSEELKGQHYLIDDDNLKKFDDENDIHIQGIPRYILVGKDGKIKDKDAPRPSSEEIKNLLVQLEK